MSTRLAPSSANALATARPRFPDAPVMTTVRSVNGIAPPRMVGAAAALEHAVLRQDLAGPELRLGANCGADRGAIDARAPRAGGREPGAVRRPILEREHALGVRRCDARAVDAHALAALDQPELDRVPIDAREVG